jgi:hypothetical protein
MNPKKRGIQVTIKRIKKKSSCKIILIGKNKSFISRRCAENTLS